MSGQLQPVPGPSERHSLHPFVFLKPSHITVTLLPTCKLHMDEIAKGISEKSQTSIF